MCVYNGHTCTEELLHQAQTEHRIPGTRRLSLATKDELADGVQRGELESECSR